METEKNVYKDWTLIDWDGNRELGYKCYRKSFGRGHVSVGVGEFTLIAYNHGPNSQNSISATRWRENGNISEIEAMRIVDKNNGYYLKDEK
jgi:hypothetical protein